MKGEVVYLYAFDVANEIVTTSIQRILESEPVPFVIRSDAPLPRDVPLFRPLAVKPRELTALLWGSVVQPLVRIYDIGVISIVLRMSVESNDLGQLHKFHKPILEDGRTLDAVARDLCAAVCDSVADAMIQPSKPGDPEAYTVFCLTDLGEREDVNRWVATNQRGIAGLLTETRPELLSEMQCAEVLRIQRSYSVNDVVIIDWDAALTIDLTGYVDDVLYALELANLQLEEYRTIDRRLDGYLNRAYVDVKRHRFSFLGTHSAVLRSLHLIEVDVTKLNDEVTHITKFLGDWFLARVYVGARERFYLEQWRRSVEDRLSRIDRLYSVVSADVINQRMVWLEMLIVMFCALEVVALFFLKR
jgi:hypothetical protein